MRATGWKGPLALGASRTILASSLEHVNIYQSKRARLTWAVSLHFSTNTLSRKWSSAAGGKLLASDVTHQREAADWLEEIMWSYPGEEAAEWLEEAGLWIWLAKCRVYADCGIFHTVDNGRSRHVHCTVPLWCLELWEKCVFVM